MSKIGEELERRLDENKYELYEACKDALFHYKEECSIYFAEHRHILERVLAKIEGKNVY